MSLENSWNTSARSHLLYNLECKLDIPSKRSKFIKEREAGSCPKPVLDKIKELSALPFITNWHIAVRPSLVSPINDVADILATMQTTVWDEVCNSGFEGVTPQSVCYLRIPTSLLFMLDTYICESHLSTTTTMSTTVIESNPPVPPNGPASSTFVQAANHLAAAGTSLSTLSTASVICCSSVYGGVEMPRPGQLLG